MNISLLSRASQAARSFFSLKNGAYVTILCGFFFIASRGHGVAHTKDSTNLTKLNAADYASGEKRSAEAAKRVTPELNKEMKPLGVAVGDPIFIRVFKESQELEVWVYHKSKRKYQEFKRYKIHGVSGGLGPKTKEGDMQAVEGFYSVNRRSLNPKSRFHLSFNLGYPNLYDKAHGRTGYAIMIHGNSVSAGCYAMTDAKIEEIYTLCAEALKNGQKTVPVHCFPFRMTKENMDKVKTNKWYDFWLNLKTGYDLFEKDHLPPVVNVSEKHYVFEK